MFIITINAILLNTIGRSLPAAFAISYISHQKIAVACVLQQHYIYNVALIHFALKILVSITKKGNTLLNIIIITK